MSCSSLLIQAAKELREKVKVNHFSEPVAYVYHPLEYAWAPHEAYLHQFGATRKKVLFLGMNPGPFGMAQTGIPFGEVAAVRDWMGISAVVEKPAKEHPKRLIQGFDCERSEVSGRRLWGLFAQRFGPAQRFFQDHFVVNFCPLVFMESTGRNRTPDKLPAAEMEPVLKACEQHLQRVVEVLEPEWLVGVGGFAESRLRDCFGATSSRIARMLHPSPASPAANRDWAGRAAQQLMEQGVWISNSRVA